MDELNASIKSYQALIAEKDEKLSELGVKLDNESSSQRENELLEELAAYKNKNNVSPNLLSFIIFAPYRFRFYLAAICFYTLHLKIARIRIKNLAINFSLKKIHVSYLFVLICFIVVYSKHELEFMRSNSFDYIILVI